ncbi:unnamed protein product [Linum trigynum]|uniref:Uncharacterized protein n=1 Tax=Linum trigynum TaxID=586398 RepID=A0AAV2E4G8_9ROSI
MASMFKLLRLTIFFALALSVLFAAAEAGRPFNIMKSETAQAAGCAIDRFFDGLVLGGMKNSGPSPGVGHSFTTGTHQ